MSKLATFCPYCGGKVPPGGRCRCRQRTEARRGAKRKRRYSGNDQERMRREPWRKQYASAEYQSARQQAIARTAGRCSDCGRVCAWLDGNRWRTAGMGGEVDHVVPLRHGGTNEASNLQLRCASCHRKAEARRSRPPTT